MVNFNLKLRLQPHPCKKINKAKRVIQAHCKFTEDNSLNTITRVDHEQCALKRPTDISTKMVPLNPHKKDLRLREVLKKCRSLQSLHFHQRVFPPDCRPSTVDLKKTFYFCFKPCLEHNHAVGSFQYHTKMLENKLFFPFKDAEQRVLTITLKGFFLL